MNYKPQTLRSGRRAAAGLPQSLFSRSNTNTTIGPNPDALPYTYGLNGVNLELDGKLLRGLWISIITVVLIVLVLRVWQLFSCHLRHIYCLSANKQQQNYWSFDKTWVWPWLKRHLIYAPLGKKRHNAELQLSKAINYGSLPGRIHTLLLAAYLISNIVYCSVLDYRSQNKAALLAELRGRSGILATANLIPLIVLSGRNNPGIPLLKISFDTFNLFHRWIGRMIAVESTLHVLAWYFNTVAAKGPQGAWNSFSGNTFLTWGLVAMLAMAVTLVQSLSAIRHAFYETFLHLHQILAFFIILGVYVHLEVSNLPALPYIRAAVALWLIDRSARLARILYLNFSAHGGRTRVTIEALAGGACRVTFQLPRHVTIRPGSHVYAYIPRMALWMSHPFSVAWTNPEAAPPTGYIISDDNEPDTPCSIEKQPTSITTRQLSHTSSSAPTCASVIIAARTGMTRQIYERALRAPDHRLHMSGFLEGPYAGHDSLASYGTVIMFAGGAGITHHLIQIRHLLNCIQARTVATRRIILVWSVRDVEALAWVRPWMDEILLMEGRRDVLKLAVYVTKPRPGAPASYSSSSETIRLNTGRCVPGTVLDEELRHRVGATMVSVCGPGAFADEVRHAVRQRVGMGCVDMNEESFTW